VEDDYLLTLHSVSVIAGNYADAAIAQAAWNSATLSGSSLLPLEPAAKRLKELDRWLARLPSALRRDQSKGDFEHAFKVPFSIRVDARR